MAVAFSTGVASTNNTTAVSATLNVNANDLVLVGFGYTGSTVAPTIFVNSTAATVIASQSSQPTTGAVTAYQALVYSQPSATGVLTVSCTMSSNFGAAMSVATYSGVHKTSPIGSTAKSTGNSTTPSIAVNSSAGSLSIGYAAYPSTLVSNVTGISSGTGSVLRSSALSTADFVAVAAALSEVPSSAVASTAAWVVNDLAAKNWASFGVTLNPAAVGGPQIHWMQ